MRVKSPLHSILDLYYPLRRLSKPVQSCHQSVHSQSCLLLCPQQKIPIRKMEMFGNLELIGRHCNESYKSRIPSWICLSRSVGFLSSLESAINKIERKSYLNILSTIYFQKPTYLLSRSSGTLSHSNQLLLKDLPFVIDTGFLTVSNFLSYIKHKPGPGAFLFSGILLARPWFDRGHITTMENPLLSPILEAK